tara:strand:- start:1865 stop:2017 length:153 start_codon:yes stop_codon:yes gene_type:complete
MSHETEPIQELAADSDQAAIIAKLNEIIQRINDVFYPVENINVDSNAHDK